MTAGNVGNRSMSLLRNKLTALTHFTYVSFHEGAAGLQSKPP